jgi:hypothetical protein
MQEAYRKGIDTAKNSRIKVRITIRFRGFMLTLVDRAELHRLLDYNEETGVFTWKVSVSNVKAGSVAGTRHGTSLGWTSYWQIRIGGHLYLRHRLAWFYVYGAWPSIHLDHIDNTPGHDWIKNLRDVTVTVNQHNRRRACRGNKTGLLGVTQRPDGAFVARIGVGRRTKFLGVFSDADAASNAYLAAKKIYHPSAPL